MANGDDLRPLRGQQGQTATGIQAAVTVRSHEESSEILAIDADCRRIAALNLPPCGNYSTVVEIHVAPLVLAKRATAAGSIEIAEVGEKHTVCSTGQLAVESKIPVRSGDLHALHPAKRIAAIVMTAGSRRRGGMRNRECQSPSGSFHDPSSPRRQIVKQVYHRPLARLRENRVPCLGNVPCWQDLTTMPRTTALPCYFRMQRSLSLKPYSPQNRCNAMYRFLRHFEGVRHESPSSVLRFGGRICIHDSRPGRLRTRLRLQRPEPADAGRRRHGGREHCPAAGRAVRDQWQPGDVDPIQGN